MMRLDGRRLVRATLLTLALFLFVGGGAGFVLAASEPDQLAVPAPRPGDGAAYTAHEVVIDGRRAIELPARLTLSRASFQWLSERQVVDTDFRLRPSHPLLAEYVFDEGGEAENHHVFLIDVDAVTGLPIQRSEAFDNDWCGSNAPGVNVMLGGCDAAFPGPFVYKVHESYRIDSIGALHGPCGMVASLQGRVHDGGPITVTGACDWPGGEPVNTYAPKGWRDADERLGLGRRFAFQADNGTGLAISFDGRSPFPVRLGMVADDLLAEGYTYGRYWDLRRTDIQAGTDIYAPVADDGAQPDPVGLVERTPWMIDDGPLQMTLPLGRAYAAAVAQTTRATDETALGTPGEPGQPFAGEWLASHPQAYMPFAMRLETVDRNGARNPSWLMLWVQGDAWLGKQVYEEPLGFRDIISLPEAGGRSIVVRDWTPSWLPDDPSSYFPPASLLPAGVPDVAELMDRYVQANPGELANRVGFETVCRGSGCSRAALFVEVGSHEQPQRDIAQGYQAAFDTFTTEIDKMRVDRDGRLVVRTDLVQSQQGWASSTPQADGPAPDAAKASAPVGAWVFPAAPTAATGISVLALIGGALYYFWPAVKGAALGLFSRTRDDALLDHPTRRRILDAIESEPGIHFMELSRKADLGRSSLEHHLRKMQAANLITRQQGPGFTCYFPKGRVDRHLMGAAPSLRSDGSRALLQAIAASPGTSSRELAATLGITPSTISYHLKRLETAGLVAPGIRAGVRLTPLGEQARAVAA